MIDWKILFEAIVKVAVRVLLIALFLVPFILAAAVSGWFILIYPILFIVGDIYEVYDEIKTNKRMRELYDEYDETED